jgi:hypothetical protein
MDEYMRAGGNIPLVLNKDLTETAKRMQEGYLEEDPDIGIIQAWLEDHKEVDRVCAVQLWKEALQHEFERYTRKDINAIHEIMRNNVKGWRSCGHQRCGKYGLQRAYERETADEWVEVSDEDLPFND